MKKVTIIVLILSVATISISRAGDPLNILGLENYAREKAESLLDPVADSFNSILNSGIYAPTSAKRINIGVEVLTLYPLKNEGVLTNAPVSAIPFPLLFAGIKLPILPVSAFMRAIKFPIEYEGEKPLIIGGGIGWEAWNPPVIPLKINLVLSYHLLKDFPHLDANAWTGTVITTLSFPKIKAYANFGYGQAKVTAKNITFAGQSVAEDFEVTNKNFRAGFGIDLGFIPSMGINFEYNILPSSVITASLMVRF